MVTPWKQKFSWHLELNGNSHRRLTYGGTQPRCRQLPERHSQCKCSIRFQKDVSRNIPSRDVGITVQQRQSLTKGQGGASWLISNQACQAFSLAKLVWLGFLKFSHPWSYINRVWQKPEWEFKSSEHNTSYIWYFFKYIYRTSPSRSRTLQSTVSWLSWCLQAFSAIKMRKWGKFSWMCSKLR